MLTIERLKELLTYDPCTGLFTRRVTINNGCGHRTKAGDIAGNFLSHERGYVYITIDKRRYSAHQLAWLYMTGEWPTIGVDHWDRNEANNRWDNLRLASVSMNRANTTMPITNTSGAKGVHPSNRLGKPWRACIQGRYLGLFATVEEAKAAYDEAARELYKEFYRP
jgi:HNH endonuclease